MKNWTNLNVNKKTMIENYKIAIFDKDIKNIQLNTSDFICNNHASLLLETIIEMYFDFYINDISIIKNISHCMEIIKNFNKIYLTQEKIHFNILSNQLMFLEKSEKKYYKKGYEVGLSVDKNFLLKNIVDINKKTYITIVQYVPPETHNHFLELIYYISSSNKNKVFDLLNTIINKFKRVKLIKNIETINEIFKDHLIILLFELFKIYKNYVNNPKLDNTFDICYEIFNWKLKKCNIIQRTSILFILFEMILTNKTYSIKSKNTIIDIDNVNNIYSQLMEYYGIGKNKMNGEVEAKAKKEMNKKNKDERKSSKDDTGCHNEKSDESEIDSKMGYLYNMFDFDKKEIKHKHHKMEKNKYNMMNNSNKPIELDCNEKIFNASVRNNVDIIKNY
tara:strand:- start:393 stop:1565 length:1173 start_codon:yes stop_codon:yes gene_type:complete